MKPFSLIALFLCGCSLIASTQEKISISPSYLRKTGDFIVPAKGDTVLFNTGGIALIDTQLLNTTMEIARLLDASGLDAATRLTLETNERKIAECERLYSELLENCRKEHELNTRSLALTQQSVDELSVSLVNTKEALVRANASIDEARRQIRKSRLPRLWHMIYAPQRIR